MGTWSEWHLDTWEKNKAHKRGGQTLFKRHLSFMGIGEGGKKEKKKKKSKKQKQNKKNSNCESISVQWWKDKENPSLAMDHWTQAWPVAEILPTRGLFFSYRSTSCRLSAKQSVEKHCYYNPIQFLLRSPRTDRILLS